MITDFHNEDTRKVWLGEFSRRLPNNRLEALKGDRAGQWSIRINDQWRVCFEWNDGHASRVEICDCH